MLEYYRNHKERVLNAIDGIYEAIDKSRECGYIAKVAETQAVSADKATEMVFENDACELIAEDLIDEVIELVQALYWAREWGEDLAFPMKDRDTPNPARAEFYKELGTAIKNAPANARELKKGTAENDA
jgi:hypothetical protein